MQESDGETMRLKVTLSVLVVSMLIAFPLSCTDAQPRPVVEDASLQAFSSAENQSGWLATAGGSNLERITSILPLSNGSTIVGGDFQQTIDFNGDVIGFASEDSDFGVDFFLAWLDENGTWTNTMTGFSVGLDSVDALAQLSDGTVLVAGSYCGITKEDACNMTLGALEPLEKADDNHENAVFLAAMTPLGEWMWGTSYSTEYEISVLDMMVDQNDEIHLVLKHSGMLDLGDDVFLGSGVESTLSLLVLDHLGDRLYFNEVISSYDIESWGSLCLDGTGQTYLASTFVDLVRFGTHEVFSQGGSNIAIAQYNSGGWLWASGAGGAGDSTVVDCAGRPDGGVAVVGDFLQNMTFGDIELDPAVWVDFYEAHLSQNGTWLHASGFGGNGADHAAALKVTEQGDSIITGKTTGSVTLGEFLLNDIDGVNDGNHYDVFLGLRQANSDWDWAIVVGGQGNDLPHELEMSSSGSPVISFSSNQDGEFGTHLFDQRDQYDVGVWLYETDLDFDGVLDGVDNCPKTVNSDQANLDNDAFGDVCDDDIDGDGVSNTDDDCPTGDMGWAANSISDHDSDGCRDLTEDLDDDEDGIFDEQDLCPKGPVGWVSTEETDIESDGCSDEDNDNDGFVDQADNCPAMANPTQADLDNDGVGDVCDLDKDGDGITIPNDNCPNDINSWISFSWNDYDSDGCLDDGADEDDDDDGVLDTNDDCPLGEKNWGDNASTLDHDGDGCHDDLEDEDDDQDGIKDPIDRCPRGLIGLAQTGQDNDGDGCIDAVEDDDDDQDGVLDPLDRCANTDPSQQVSSNGCSQYQLDDDNDGVVNAYDFCLDSPVGAVVDERGCGDRAVEPAGETDSSGFGLAGAFFLLTGIIIVYAVYLNNKRPGPPLPKQPVGFEAPPERPAMDEEA